MISQLIQSGKRALAIAITVTQLIACGSEGGSNSSGNSVIKGSVGDGPITGATVTIYDASGEQISSVTSDIYATYKSTIKTKGLVYPLTLEVSGGVDLVTGATPDFKMYSVAEKGENSININPFSTLAVKIAQMMPGGVNEENIDMAKQYVSSQLGFGLDPDVIGDLITTRINDDNVANMVKASEAMGEMVRRTRDVVTSTGTMVSGDDVMDAIAADMVDGFLDGAGAPETSPAISAAANVVSGQVLVEALSNTLKVGGVIATDRMDQAIQLTRIDIHPDKMTDSVRITEGMLQQTKVALAAARVLDSSDQVIAIANSLEGISANSLPGDVAGDLPPDTSGSLNAAVMRSSTAADEEMSAVNQAVHADVAGSSGSTGSGNTDTGDTGGTAGSGNTGGTAGSGNTGGTAGSGDTGGTAGSGDTGGTAGSGDTGGTAGSGDTGGTAGSGDTGGTAGSGDTGGTAGSGDTGGTTGSGGSRWNNWLRGSGGTTGTGDTGSADTGDTGSADTGDTGSADTGDTGSAGSGDSGSAGSGDTGSASSGDSGGAGNGDTGSADNDDAGSDDTGGGDGEPTNTAPVISGNPAGSVAADENYSFRPNASDADGNVLAFSIANKPGWASFSDTTGRLSGTPNNDDADVYDNIRISVTDGLDTARLPAFSIRVDAVVVQTGSFTLGWTAPVARTDGTALSLADIDGYRIHYGPSSGKYPDTVNVTDGSAQSITVTDVPAGEYHVVMTTVDTDGLESGYSSEIIKTAQ